MFNKRNLLFISFLFVALSMRAQSSPAEVLAGKIANRMRDSLSLTGAQRDSVYAINMRLNDLKMALRRQYPIGDPLRDKIQAVEKTRDSLYLPVLGNEKFPVYRTKKRNLISNN